MTDIRLGTVTGSPPGYCQVAVVEVYPVCTEMVKGCRYFTFLTWSVIKMFLGLGCK